MKAFAVCVDQVMVGIENVEATFQSWLDACEDREILMVLDIVVSVQISQEEVETRRKELCELTRIRTALPIVSNRACQYAAHLAKHVVPLQPEHRHAMHVLVFGPFTTWVFLDQEAQIVR
jgi:hypothetical protein